MKNKLLLTILTSASILTLVARSEMTYATDSGLGVKGNVTVKASDKTDPVDPENPLTPVDPGESPSTKGALRLDFVSAINFADVKITEKSRNYASLAQLFHDSTSARGSFVQITDLRKASPGWSLQLKQETQFKNADSVELNGAVLSFDKGWANSGGTGKAPSVFSDTISIDTIGSSYAVASASQGSGNGTWTISFGASKTNRQSQGATLSPIMDKDGKAVVDSVFKKPTYANSAVTLSVPDKTNILPGKYQTKLTWMLQATP